MAYLEYMYRYFRFRYRLWSYLRTIGGIENVGTNFERLCCLLNDIEPVLFRKYTPSIGGAVEFTTCFRNAGYLISWLDLANKVVKTKTYLSDAPALTAPLMIETQSDIDAFLVNDNGFDIPITEFVFDYRSLLLSLRTAIDETEDESLKRMYNRKLGGFIKNLLAIEEGLLEIALTFRP